MSWLRSTRSCAEPDDDPYGSLTTLAAVVLRRVRAHAPLLASVTITTVWTGLALRHPTLTYHFAPVLAAAAWPLVARFTRGRTSLAVGLRAATGGIVVTALAAAELHALDALRGPALIGGSATTEALLGALGGAAWGTRVITRARPGLLIRLLAGPADTT